jgi:hypothetical protein
MRADLVRLHGGTLKAVTLTPLNSGTRGSTGTMTVWNVEDSCNGRMVLPS